MAWLLLTLGLTLQLCIHVVHAGCECQLERVSPREEGYILLLCGLCYDPSVLGAPHDKWTWFMAEEKCDKLEGRLAVLNSRQKTLRAYRLLQQKQGTAVQEIHVWTAAHHMDKRWTWAGNEDIYQLWGPEGDVSLTRSQLYTQSPQNGPTKYDLLLTTKSWEVARRHASDKRPHDLWGYLCEIDSNKDKEINGEIERPGIESPSKEPESETKSPNDHDKGDNGSNNVTLAIAVAVAVASVSFLIGIIIIYLIIRQKRPEAIDRFNNNSAIYTDPESIHKTENPAIKLSEHYSKLRPTTKSKQWNSQRQDVHSLGEEPLYTEVDYAQGAAGENQYAIIEEVSHVSDMNGSAAANMPHYYELENAVDPPTVKYQNEEPHGLSESVQADESSIELSENCDKAKDRETIDVTSLEKPPLVEGSYDTVLVENDLYR